MLGLIHRAALGLGPPQFRDLFSACAELAGCCRCRGQHLAPSATNKRKAEHAFLPRFIRVRAYPRLQRSPGRNAKSVRIFQISAGYFIARRCRRFAGLGVHFFSDGASHLILPVFTLHIVLLPRPPAFRVPPVV